MKKVRKRFDLRGSSQIALEWRLSSLRRALSARNGRIIEVRWSRAGDERNARVLYEVLLPQQQNTPLEPLVARSGS
jgi:hypothetical protein